MRYDLKDFVRESNRIEGILRAPLPAEIRAHEAFLATEDPAIDDLILFVERVAPGHRLRDEIGLNVRVGGHIAPSGGPAIRESLKRMLENLRLYTPHEAHVAYELLHPFTDGNGRSGRALWLHMMEGDAPLGFLHQFYYQTLSAAR